MEMDELVFTIDRLDDLGSEPGSGGFVVFDVGVRAEIPNFTDPLVVTEQITYRITIDYLANNRPIPFNYICTKLESELRKQLEGRSVHVKKIIFEKGPGVP